MASLLLYSGVGKSQPLNLRRLHSFPRSCQIYWLDWTLSECPLRAAINGPSHEGMHFRFPVGLSWKWTDWCRPPTSHCSQAKFMSWLENLIQMKTVTTGLLVLSPSRRGIESFPKANTNIPNGVAPALSGIIVVSVSISAASMLSSKRK